MRKQSNSNWLTVAVALLGLAMCSCLASKAKADTIDQARASVSVMSQAQKDEGIKAIVEDLNHRKGKSSNQVSVFTGKGMIASLASKPCGVNYKPVVFAGKPDPFPPGEFLTNEEILARYITRYGCEPGVRPCRPGYSAELFGLNQEALLNAATLTGQGPEGEALIPNSCTLITEETDASFRIPRTSPYIAQYVVRVREAQEKATPDKISDTSKPCGPGSEQRIMFSFYPFTYYWINNPPCGGSPEDKCGNGVVDPGETCLTCPKDAGECPPPPPPPTKCESPKSCVLLIDFPKSSNDDCATILSWYSPGTGRYAKIKKLCTQIKKVNKYIE